MDDYFQRQNATSNWTSDSKMLEARSSKFLWLREYNYVKRNDFSVDFIMTKAEEARVITHYQEALEMKHQFVLRLVDGNSGYLMRKFTVLRTKKLGILTPL